LRVGEGDDKEAEEYWCNASAIMFGTSAQESTVWLAGMDTPEQQSIIVTCALIR
jgi:hypothetical protein